MVTVLQAKLAKNYGFSRMDPFCRLTVGLQAGETGVCENGAQRMREINMKIAILRKENGREL